MQTFLCSNAFYRMLNSRILFLVFESSYYLTISLFNREEAKTIKGVMEAFGKEIYRSIGTFLVFTADKKETLFNSEYKAMTSACAFINADGGWVM